MEEIVEKETPTKQSFKKEKVQYENWKLNCGEKR